MSAIRREIAGAFKIVVSPRGSVIIDRHTRFSSSNGKFVSNLSHQSTLHHGDNRADHSLTYLPTRPIPLDPHHLFRQVHSDRPSDRLIIITARKRCTPYII